jgi:hypothetical protein
MATCRTDVLSVLHSAATPQGGNSFLEISVYDLSQKSRAAFKLRKK